MLTDSGQGVKMQYRNHHIGVQQIDWRYPHAKLVGKWKAVVNHREVGIIVDTEEDAWKLAKDVVDYNYRIKGWEAFYKRKYSPMKDGNLQYWWDKEKMLSLQELLMNQSLLAHGLKIGRTK